jgi:uncharacterized protein (DUF1778 family)
MSIVAPARKPLGVRATAEQHRILTEAAAREHRSVSSYVLSAALKAAETPRYTEEEAVAIVREAQEMFRKSSASGRDLLEELFAERRADAARG